MCGIIGCFPKNNVVSNEQAISASKLLYQSRVRGMHAYGISKQFDRNWDVMKTFSINEAVQFCKAGAKCIIAHTRYDTSGDWKVLNNNQPIFVDGDFLVFNGVIRMGTKEEREAEFDTKYETDNDGEILLQMLQHAYEARDAKFLLNDVKVSYAGIQVVNNQITYFRNERRPLVTYQAPDCLWIASTLDILRRVFGAFVDDYCNSVKPGEFHYVKQN